MKLKNSYRNILIGMAVFLSFLFIFLPVGAQDNIPIEISGEVVEGVEIGQKETEQPPQENSGKSMTIEEIMTLKKNLSSAQKKLSTDLLELTDNKFTLPGQSREDVKNQLRMSNTLKEEMAIRKDGSFPEEHVHVYIRLKSHNSSVVEPYVEQMINCDEENGLVVAWVKVDQLNALASLEEVRNIETVEPPIIRGNTVITEGDTIHETDKVRNIYGQKGAGIKIGVISDGVTSRVDSINKGELPEYLREEGANKHVLRNSYRYGGDEGTAMLEIIYDLAPQAELYFHDCGNDIIEFNEAIDALKNVGCQIICDDIGWIKQPFFEDGEIATHIKNIVNDINNKILFVSAAGNEALRHYQGMFRGYEVKGNQWHDFSEGTDENNKQLYVDIPEGGGIRIVLQWADPFIASGNDYDLYLYDYNTADLLAYSIATQDGDDSPLEYITYTNHSDKDIKAYISIIKTKGENKNIEVFFHPNWTVSDKKRNIKTEDSIFGHPAVPGVITVGAINAENNGEIAFYSSHGPSTIRTEKDRRLKPDICGIDGVSITGAGSFPTTFYGTSASTPHIAGMGALLWSQLPDKSPEEIRELITSAAVDYGAEGYDYIFGYGLANAVSVFYEQATPQSPTDPVVDNANGTFGWTYLKGLEKPENYEYRIESADWITCKSNPLPLPNKYISKGCIQVRLKSDQTTGRKSGEILYSDKEYTYDPNPPAEPVVTGVENNRTYGESVTAEWKQEEEGISITATLNGSPYSKGTEITKDGKYILIVTAEKKKNGLKRDVQIKFFLDKEPPEPLKILGVEEDHTYKSVKPTWAEADGTSSTATLSKNGKKVDSYKSGDKITENGEYELAVVVTKENNRLTAESSVNFTINNQAPELPEIVDEKGELLEEGKVYQSVTPDWKVPQGTETLAKLNEVHYEKNTPITEGGNYKLTVTAAVYGGESDLTSSASINFAIDTRPPEVEAPSQTATNSGDQQKEVSQQVFVQSDEGSGFVYIIKDGIPQETLEDFKEALTNNNGAKAPVKKANEYVAIATRGLDEGTYYAYALDSAENISRKGRNKIEIEEKNTPNRFASNVDIDGNTIDADGDDWEELRVDLYDDDGSKCSKPYWIYVATNRGETDNFDTNDGSICVKGKYGTAILVENGAAEFSIKSEHPGLANIGVGLNDKVYDYVIGDPEIDEADTELIESIKNIKFLNTSAKLRDIDLNIEVLDFDDDKEQYFVDVENTVDTITVTPKKAYEQQTIVVKAEGERIEGSLDNLYNINLQEESNLIEIKVTAEDGASTKVYTVEVYRKKLDNSVELANINISPGKLVPAFKRSVLNYTVTVENKAEKITITPIKGHEKQTIQAKANGYIITDGPPYISNLNEGANSFELKVIAEDGITEQTYHIKVTRDGEIPKPPSGGGSSGGSSGSWAPPEEPSDPILRNLRTEDDQALDKSLQKTGYARLDLRKDKDSQAEISTGVINQLYTKKLPLLIGNSGVEVIFKPESLLTKEVRDAMARSGTVRIGVRELTPAEKSGVLTSFALGENAGAFEAGGRIFNLTALAAFSLDDAVDIERFTEPVALTLDMRGNNLTPEQIQELCGVRFEKDELGRTIPLKLGGQYDSEKQTFTFFTESFSLYSVMRVKDLSCIKLTVGTQVAEVNGEYKTIDAAPKIINNRTMVPLRVIGEALGAEFAWEGVSKTVKFKLDNKELNLKVGESTEEMDTPPVIIEGRTLVPVRYIAEAFGADVTWFKSAQTVQVVK